MVKNRDNNKIKTFLIIFCLFLFLFLAFLPYEINMRLDDNIRIFKGQEHSLQVRFPFDLYIRVDKEGILDINGNPITSSAFNRFNYHNDIFLRGITEGDVTLELSFFEGLITLKQLTVNVLPEKEVMAGGHSIGIKLHEEGIVVAGYHYLPNRDDSFSPAKESGVQVGDILLKVNEISLRDIDRAADVIKRESEKGALTFLLNRKGNIFETTVRPFFCTVEQDYRIGLYIRDNAAGVGTLTFYDPGSSSYGALGHVITDIDTNIAMEISEGLIVRADVINVKAAERGQPGEKAGIFREGKDIVGSIEKNTSFGIYGKLKNIVDHTTPYPDPLPLALTFEVETGPAELLTVIEGNKIQSFKIYIERTANQNKPSDKGMIIRVIDEDLLQVTGGIVQGMSGSPIIQNGRLVGAVTHVFVNDPTRGYAIYAEWMARECEILPVFK
ncbi:MAG TPA: SpoIVB peptidase [Firmicutes bacterium]|nr:SpoIVB peptidase [Bacillota bacterium]